MKVSAALFFEKQIEILKIHEILIVHMLNLENRHFIRVKA